MEKALKQWNLAWDNHDLEGVMALFHEDVVFDNWTGEKVRGKRTLRKAWEPWFSNHGNFRFVEEETFIDEKEQKVLYRWLLEWPSFESGCEGKPEKRRGVDVIHYQTKNYKTLQVQIERIMIIKGFSSCPDAIQVNTMKPI
ncbi:MAG: nuclear transport factor 2 family protein [Deltaproteobacteria bacterium]|nr:nuclear transport factor 2 family protein [Deltaproteobacteria bacterium]